MRKKMKLIALSWLHRVVSSAKKRIETQLNNTLDPFTQADYQDEVLNRYPL